jgi:hypothetical protein
VFGGTGKSELLEGWYVLMWEKAVKDSGSVRRHRLTSGWEEDV